MKSLNEYINENNEQQINEQYFPPVESFPPEWRPYITALYLFLIWYCSVFLLSATEDITGGIGPAYKWLKKIITKPFRDFKYKKQLKEINSLLEQDSDYLEWKNNKKRRLKDLKPIIEKYKNDDTLRKVIDDITNDIWFESNPRKKN